MFIFRNVLFLFTVVAVAEVMLFVQFGQWFGILWTVLCVVATAVMGVVLLRIEGLETLRRFQQSVASGRLPAVEMVEGVLLLIAAALLLTPGFLTDLVGFLMLIKPSRIVIARYVVSHGLISVMNYRETDQRGPTNKSSHNNPSDYQSSFRYSKSVDDDIGFGQQRRHSTVVEGEYEIKVEPTDSKPPSG